MRGKVGLERRCYSYDSSLHLSQTIGLCASPLWLCLEPSFSLASFCIQKGNRISFSSPKWGPWKHITPWGHGTNVALQIVFLQHLLVSGIFLCFLQHISCCDSIFTVSAWESVWEESLSLLPQPVTYHTHTVAVMWNMVGEMLGIFVVLSWKHYGDSICIGYDVINMLGVM